MKTNLTIGMKVEDDKGRRYVIEGYTNIFGIPAVKLCRIMKNTGSRSIHGKKDEAISTIEKFYKILES